MNGEEARVKIRCQKERFNIFGVVCICVPAFVRVCKCPRVSNVGGMCV